MRTFQANPNALLRSAHKGVGDLARKVRLHAAPQFQVFKNALAGQRGFALVSPLCRIGQKPDRFAAFEAKTREWQEEVLIEAPEFTHGLKEHGRAFQNVDAVQFERSRDAIAYLLTR